MLISPDQVKILHLEPTDFCQAACPACAREVDPEFKKWQRHHLDMHKIMQVFDYDCIAQLDKMFMCGNYGDPAAGLNTLNILREFRKINKDIVLGMNTNGALRSPLWWEEVANILNRQQDYVVFSIDGLENTNHIYRKGVKWNSLMFNVKAFIAAGGNAHWDMLVYEHNKHQVDACEQLARDLGFKWFRAKVSRRPLYDQLQYPVDWTRPTKSQGTVRCAALEEKSVYIDAQGRIIPCCWLGVNQHEVSNAGTADNEVCQSVCGTVESLTTFKSQWQREVELC